MLWPEQLLVRYTRVSELKLSSTGWGLAMEPCWLRPLLALFIVLTSRVFSTEGSLTTCELRVSVCCRVARNRYVRTDSAADGKLYVRINLKVAVQRMETVCVYVCIWSHEYLLRRKEARSYEGSAEHYAR